MRDFAPFKSAAAQAEYLRRHKERSADWPQPWSDRMVPGTWGQTYVREAGKPDGPPLVLLPGVGSPSYSLSQLAHRLAPYCHLYAVDNIYDIGRSIPSRPLATADDFTSWLDGLFDALGLARPNLLGLSYGGWISSQHALRRPERVSRLVLLAPAGTVAPINFAFIWRAVLTVVWKPFMANFADWAGPGMARDPKWAQVRANLIADAHLGQKAFARRKLVPPIPPPDEAWKTLSVPTLLMFGEREVIFDPLQAEKKMRALAPQVQLEVLPGVSHDFFAVAADEVAKRVLAFLGSA